ncbi:hypothetical protein GP486_005641 [Trichoglossum hirsutum]|uniref:Uncharacterized protein n=1 Tax=Trichoglossum hirsutum TaxID=265104 RepID=A0A9P8L8V6_9PEZI|nr:hypothetical protein GP486_005641 [Trichoglossum hirsutum]
MSASIDNDVSIPLEVTAERPPPIDDDASFSFFSLEDTVSFTTQATPSPPPPPVKTRSMSIARLLELYRLHKEGCMWEVGSPWIEVPLLYEEYHELKAILEKNDSLARYVKGSVRQEYDYKARKMIVQYPDNHHYSIFINRVVNDIVEQLHKIHKSDNKEAARIAENIWLFVASEAMTTNEWNHDADVVFLSGSSEYPNHPRVVIEASFPPKRKYLPHLVHEHMSNVEIELVIGLDIDHWGSKKASVSIWRSTSRRDGNKQTLKDDYFRLDDGSAAEEGSLTFQLRDFLGPWEERRGRAGLDIPISIPYSKLAEYLDHAEREFAERAQRERRGIAVARRPMM